MRDFLMQAFAILDMPLKLKHLLALCVGVYVAGKTWERITDWQWEREYRKRNDKTANTKKPTSGEKVKRAIYNPKQFRGWSGNEPYDPEKHFRRDGKIDRKW